MRLKFKNIFRVGISILSVWLMNMPAGIAQTTADAGLWTTVSLEIGLNAKFALLLKEEMRIRENFSRVNLFYTNIGLEYKLSKSIKTNFVYRFFQKLNQDNTFRYGHRAQWDVSIKKKYGNFKLSLRHRLQMGLFNVYSSETGYMPRWSSRSKFRVKYDLNKPYTPYFSVELRYQIHDPKNQESDNAINRIRYELGVDYKINKRNSVGVYYLIQNKINISEPEDLYVVGIEYNIKL